MGTDDGSQHQVAFLNYLKQFVWFYILKYSLSIFKFLYIRLVKVYNENLEVYAWGEKETIACKINKTRKTFVGCFTHDYSRCFWDWDYRAMGRWMTEAHFWTLCQYFNIMMNILLLHMWWCDSTSPVASWLLIILTLSLGQGGHGWAHYQPPAWANNPVLYTWPPPRHWAGSPTTAHRTTSVGILISCPTITSPSRARAQGKIMTFTKTL